MNAGAIRDLAEARFGDPLNVIVTEATWLSLINEGYMEFAGASRDWPFLEVVTSGLSVTAGTNEVTLPAGFAVLAVYNDTADLPMNELPGRRTGYDAFPLRAASLGTPEAYRLFNNKLQVFPWAEVTTALIVEYVAAPADLTAGDSPVFPSQYHHALVHYALSQAYLDDGDESAAERHEARWRRTLGQMQTDLLGARGDSYPQITDAGI